MTFTRRDLFLGGLSIAGLAALSPEALAGQRPAKSRARRVLIVNLAGGVRSSAAFIASADKQLNPWGRIEGVRLPLGRVLEPERTQAQRINVPGPAPSSSRRGRRRTPGAVDSYGAVLVPPLSKIADRFAVLGTWDSERGDHVRSERVAHTGTTSESGAGLLVRVFGALTERDGRDGPPLPAFELGDAGSASFTPRGFEDGATVQVTGPGQLPRRDDSKVVGADKVGAAFVPRVSARDQLDRDMLDTMGPGGRPAVLAYSQQRRLAEQLSHKLDDPVVAFGGRFGGGGRSSLGKLDVDGRKVPLTNDILAETLGGFGGDGAETNLMLAIRLMQLGSPAVSVSLSGFDMHSGEDDRAPALYGRIGRVWSALHFILSRTEDPEDPRRSMLDTTLVMTNSEFGRDPGTPRTGFNGGGGSDHGSHAATFYVGHAIMGAGVRGGNYLGRVDTKSYDARRARERFAPADLLATVLYALGIDSARWGFAEAKPIVGLWGRA